MFGKSKRVLPFSLAITCKKSFPNNFHYSDHLKDNMGLILPFISPSYQIGGFYSTIIIYTLKY